MSDSPDQKVALGCGTLILIAIIVLIFGNAGSDDIGKRLDKIDARLERLEKKLDARK